MPELAPHALIVGCGYLGQRVAARLLAAGRTVFATTRSPQRAVAFSQHGLRPLLVDVTQRLTLTALAPALEAEALDVYYLVPPGRPSHANNPAQTVREGIAHTTHALGKANVRRAVLVSSTAVYSQSGGALVSAETAAEPTDPRGQLLLEGEKLWQSTLPPARVLRLAGLYGPGRVIGRQAILDGSPIVGNPRALLNLIHVDDAADLLIAMMRAAAPADVELGADGSPVERLAYYRTLAERLGAPEPRVLDDAQAAAELNIDTRRLRRASSKACDPTTTRQRTGWRPTYPDIDAGLGSLELTADSA